MDLSIKYCNTSISNINIGNNFADIADICVNIADINSISNIYANIDIANMHNVLCYRQMHVVQHTAYPISALFILPILTPWQ